MKLERENFNQQAADALRAMIIDGRLADGVRINEVHLSKELGISRTPLREGLARLTSEGALNFQPCRGYFVNPLTIDECDQLYDIRPILDPEALRLAGVPGKSRIARLEKLNENLCKARDPARAIKLDDAWHMELLAECPNRVLIGFIENVIARTQRYELALFRETKNVQQAGRDHSQIIKALKANDLRAACAALKRNMQSGKAPIIKWLSQRAGAKEEFDASAA